MAGSSSDGHAGLAGVVRAGTMPASAAAITKLREAEAEAIKRYARAIKDWALLDEAVEQQIKDQRRFVEWWDVNVGVRHGPGGRKGEGAKNAELRSLMSMAKAEKLSGISQQKVSRWNGLRTLIPTLPHLRVCGTMAVEKPSHGQDEAEAPCSGAPRHRLAREAVVGRHAGRIASAVQGGVRRGRAGHGRAGGAGDWEARGGA